MRISPEAIYQALFIQERGAPRRELITCLRSGRALRVPRARRKGKGRPFVSDEIMISERPAEAEDRAVAGHWPLGDASITCQLIGGRLDPWSQELSYRHPG